MRRISFCLQNFQGIFSIQITATLHGRIGRSSLEIISKRSKPKITYLFIIKNE